MKLKLYVIIFVLFSGVFAQEEKNIEKFLDQYHNEFFNIGLTFQSVADFQSVRTDAGSNGFSIANFRLRLFGKMDYGISYFFQSNFINTPSILDARLNYNADDSWMISTGQFKAPFSAEFLIPADAIDFVNRSQVVSVLSPGRQIGLQSVFDFSVSSIQVKLSAGIFNGNRPSANINDNNDLLYAGRMEAGLNQIQSSDNITIGLNYAYSRDTGLEFASILNSADTDYYFTGKRKLFGLDGRIKSGNLLLAGEYLFGEFTGSIHKSDKIKLYNSLNPFGYYVTLGYNFDPRWQVLGRTEKYSPGADLIESKYYIGGINFWPTKVTEIQINYIIDPDKDAQKYHRLLLNSQISF